nr:hypothetical protein [Tanacetum cinerariifolium]
DEAQKENDEFLKTVDENMQKIIKEQVNKQVKVVVEAYESDKIILDTYEETVTLKRRRDEDADKDEEPSAGPERGSKRRREGKEPEKRIRLKRDKFEQKRTKPDKNGKRVEARKSQEQSQWIEQEKPKKTQKEWSKTQTRSKSY